jgi:Serine/threonine protein kinase
MTDLAEILRYLHSVAPHPIIYRDMKPSNVIIDREGRVRLVDFGIARHYKAGQDSDTKHIGTHGYAAPEQYGSNQTDARSDIYSLGVTIYHAITGKSPLEPPYELLPIRQVNPNLSEGLETIISRCVRVDPNQRYQSANELLNDIKNIHTMNRGYQQQKLKQKLAVVAVIVLILAGGLAGANYYQSLQEEKTAQYEQYLQAGTEAYKSGKFDEAEIQFNKAMAIKQNDEVYIDLARTYLREGKNEKVISFLQENINHGQLNSNSEVKYLTGTAYFNMKDFEKAVWYFKEAVKKRPGGNGR